MKHKWSVFITQSRWYEGTKIKYAGQFNLISNFSHEILLFNSWQFDQYHWNEQHSCSILQRTHRATLSYKLWLRKWTVKLRHLSCLVNDCFDPNIACQMQNPVHRRRKHIVWCMEIFNSILYQQSEIFSFFFPARFCDSIDIQMTFFYG